MTIDNLYAKFTLDARCLDLYKINNPELNYQKNFDNIVDSEAIALN